MKREKIMKSVKDKGFENLFVILFKQLKQIILQLALQKSDTYHRTYRKCRFKKNPSCESVPPKKWPHKIFCNTFLYQKQIAVSFLLYPKCNNTVAANTHKDL
jgi:hypothetical protein